MRMRDFISIVVLLLAGAAQAVNTEAPLNGPSPQGLVGYVESVLPGQSLEISGPANEMIEPALEAYPDLGLVLVTDSATILSESEGLVGQRASSPIDRLGIAADWAADRHWSTDPKRYTDAGFVNANSRINLPAFGEIDWVATPLPTVRRASLMETLVFPALGVLVILCALVILIARLRRRRSVSRIEPLLPV